MSTELLAAATVATLDAAILTRAIAPERAVLSPSLAEEILRWEFAPDDRQQMTELSAKARSGTLSSLEEARIDSYVRAAHIINLMQAKARLAIKLASRR